MTGKRPFVERILDAHNQKSIFLTDTEYPYANYQVIPLNNENRERLLGILNKHDWVLHAEGRDDFVVIHMGSCVQVSITMNDKSIVMSALYKSARYAAEWWNEHHPVPVDYDNLDIPVMGIAEFEEHPTYKGEEPIPIPEDVMQEWRTIFPKR